MYTDPNRVRADIPGTVEGNPVFAYHDAFNPDKAEVEDLKARYRAGKVGDVEVKEKLAAALNALPRPHPRAARRLRGAARASSTASSYEGTERMRAEARVTMDLVTQSHGHLERLELDPAQGRRSAEEGRGEVRAHRAGRRRRAGDERPPRPIVKNVKLIML